MDIPKLDSNDNALFVNGVRLPYRNVDVDYVSKEDGLIYGMGLRVPRGIARNNRNKSWQIKVERRGVVLASGNVSDGNDTPDQSLVRAITTLVLEIDNNKSLETVRSKGRGDRIEPYRLNDQVTLHWKVVNTTPNLYALIYSPILKKPKTVNIGSEKKIADKAFFARRVALALVYGHRVAKEEADPFRVITQDQADAFTTVAESFLGTDHSRLWENFINAGAGLRENASTQRAKQIMGIKSSLALKALKGRLA